MNSLLIGFAVGFVFFNEVEDFALDGVPDFAEEVKVFSHGIGDTPVLEFSFGGGRA